MFTGCFRVTMRRLGIPRELAPALANPRNASVPMTRDGIPRFSDSMPSWILHVVQDPQSAKPVISKSHPFSRSHSSAGAGLAAPRFRT